MTVASFPHLSKSPIQEALIDLQVRLPDTTDREAFVTLRDKLEENYPRVDEKHTHTFQMEVKKAETQRQLRTSATDLGFAGFWMTSSDEKNVLQVRLDGFTLSRLAPYTSWDDMRDRARDGWSRYVDMLKPELVTRVATRYINHIKVALPIRNIGEHLLFPPQAPSEMPGQGKGFLSRVTTEDPDRGIMVHLIQALAPGDDPHHAAIILDIDALKSVEYGAKDGVVWEALEELRIVKDQVFFSALPEAMIESFR